ncbi:MAG: hypothetical protein IPI35_06210 [Deltaproteobacteria bacterium]|nr:hypothetical protein [Deltaproteobacteria bacterium]
MGLKDLLKSTVKRALGRGEAPAPTPAPEARPTRSGSHPAPPPWRAAQAPVAQAAAPVVEPVVAPQASPEEPPWHDQVSQNPNDWMNNGALPPGDEPQVTAPTFDVVLDGAAGDEAWAPTAEERAARRDEPQEMAPPPAITPSASHDTVVELHAAPIVDATPLKPPPPSPPPAPRPRGCPR